LDISFPPSISTLLCGALFAQTLGLDLEERVGCQLLELNRGPHSEQLALAIQVVEQSPDTGPFQRVPLEAGLYILLFMGSMKEKTVLSKTISFFLLR
jgi:hypothetical protein